MTAANQPSTGGGRRPVARYLPLLFGATALAWRVGALTHSVIAGLTVLTLSCSAFIALLLVHQARRRSLLARQLSSRFIDVPAWLGVDCLPSPWPAVLHRQRASAGGALPVRLRTVPGRIALEKVDDRSSAMPFRVEIDAAVIAEVSARALTPRRCLVTFSLTCGRLVSVEIDVPTASAPALVETIRRGLGDPDRRPGDLTVLSAAGRA